MLSIFDAVEALIQTASNPAELCSDQSFDAQGEIINEIRLSRLPEGGWAFSDAEGDSFPCLIADAQYRNLRLYANEAQRREPRTRMLIRTAFECRFCREGIVSLHAACVDKSGFAIAFTGDSGIGKSTRARAWVSAPDAEFISGDRIAIRFEDSGSIACGVPWDGKEQILRDVERPLKAIVEVRRSSANIVRKLTQEQARAVLMRQVFIPMWDTDAAVFAMTNVRRLIDTTSVYRVFCGPDEADAQAIYETLFHCPERILPTSDDIRIRGSFKLIRSGDEIYANPKDSKRFRGSIELNEVSAFVFEQMQRPVSREDLLHMLVAEFDVDEATASADLAELLETFEGFGILETE